MKMFLFGFMFAVVAQPLLNLVTTALELTRNKLIDKMTKEENIRAIGFCAPKEEEEYDE